MGNAGEGKSRLQQPLLEESDFLQKIELRTPDKFTDEDRPRVSLHLLLKNAESVIQRLLDNVGPYVMEIVCVLNDTTDSTRQILEHWSLDTGKRVDITEVTCESHPELYINDTYETYAKGRSLCGEDIGGPFMERPILADWSSIRNIAWERCQGDWRLFLDADDVIEDPHSIWGLIEVLDENGCDMALTRYLWNVDGEGRARGSSYRERLARNVPDIRWVYPIHEVLHGHSKQAVVDGNLVVTDLRDSAGEDIRIPGRNFKILYYHGRMSDWEISPRMLLQLAEAGDVLPDFARHALGRYLDISTRPEERGWACCLIGESYDAEEEYESASEAYEASLKEYKGTKAAYQLCRSRYHEGKWEESIAAYEQGKKNSAVIQVVDDDPLQEKMTRILVADCLWRLSRFDEAMTMCDLAMEAFPDVYVLADMRQHIAMRATPPPWPPPRDDEDDEKESA